MALKNSIFQLGRVKAYSESIIAMFGTTQIAANAIANNLDSMEVLPNTVVQIIIRGTLWELDFEQQNIMQKNDEADLYHQRNLLSGGDPYYVCYTFAVVWSFRGNKTFRELFLALIHNGCYLFMAGRFLPLPNVMRG